MRNRPNIFSIEILIKDKFYQGPDLKDQIHFPKFQALQLAFKSESGMIEISFRFSRRDRSEVINSTIRSYKTYFFQMHRTSIPHSSKRYGHLSRLHNPFLIVLFVLEKRPHRSALMDILRPRVYTQIVNSFRPLVSLGWGRVFAFLPPKNLRAA
jgi:hypothetical protein